MPQQEIEREFWKLVAGLVNALIGMFLIRRPRERTRAVLWVAAAYAVTCSVTLIVLTLKARGVVARAQAAVGERFA
jgi:uncharacterized membrane protein HdeD (DUF308 family)